MTSPEASPEDVQEQQAALVEPAESEEGLANEEPEADAAEQRVRATGDEGLPDEASEADVAEQRVEVSFDEEDTPIG